MPTLGTQLFTLGDLAKRMDPNQKDVANVVEVLAQDNSILSILPFAEANGLVGHRVTLRNGLPTVGTRRVNEGVPVAKSTTRQFDEQTMLLESYSEVDTELLRLNGNEAALRASEDVATLEAMNQFWATRFFYGNAAQDILSFNGIATRYNSTTGDTGANIFLAGGAGADNTSIYLVGLGERGLHGIYPKGSMAGVERKDMGEQLISDGNNRRTVKTTRFTWHAGLALKDFRHCKRIANIDVSNLATFGTGSDSSARLLRLMIQAMNDIPTNALSGTYGLRYAFLMNSTTITWADIMRTEKTNGAFGMAEIDGRKFTTFRDIPIVKCDAISNAESLVS